MGTSGCNGALLLKVDSGMMMSHWPGCHIQKYLSDTNRKGDKMEMHVKPVTYKVTLRLTNEMLGTVPKDRDIYKRFVAGKAEKELSGELLEEELASLNIPEGGVAERGWTGFRYVDDAPCIVNYMIKGMFKEICKTLRKVKGSHSSKLKAYRQAISTRVHVNPRYIPLLLPWESQTLPRLIGD